MKTYKQFITEARTQITPDEEEQIVKHYTKRIKSGGNFGFPELSDETGYHHNTLRRNIFLEELKKKTQNLNLLK